ncbi:hypothetical protein EDC01DRAFT_619330 [Geopyxis carbonaria]|nr:hypothetical protein EDC01DRAFT_619330 [Geopyxis carbonaria]
MRRSAHSLLLRHYSQLRPRPHVIPRVQQLFSQRQCSSCSSPPPPAAPASSSTPSSTSNTNVKLPPDHRTIATAQQLLVTSPFSPGSPLFLPHGTHIYNKLIEFLRAQYAVYGFKEVLSPSIYKRSLWETSGHWENYKDDMFEVTGRGAGGVRDSDAPDGMEEEYGLKPMNCPGHCLMFKATSGSRGLRDMPVRYADFSPLHRNEVSGALSGLTRVRRFHQDDGHIFCRPVQITQEILSTLELIKTVYKVFNLPTPELVLSTRPENYIGDVEEWDRAEAALKQALDSSGQSWSLNEGDGAFYGPKIDVILQDSDGKRHQTATIQLDFQLPQRFGLEYFAPAPALEQKGIVSEDPEELKEHGYVTPHYNGKWPFWLSPRQAIVIPVYMSDEMIEYARDTRNLISGVTSGKDVDNAGRPLPLSRRTFAVDIDESANSLGKKIRAARTNGYNYIIVIGERNVEAGTVSVDARDRSGPAKAQAFDMSRSEVYNYFLNLENEYA